MNRENRGFWVSLLCSHRFVPKTHGLLCFSSLWLTSMDCHQKSSISTGAQRHKTASRVIRLIVCWTLLLLNCRALKLQRFLLIEENPGFTIACSVVYLQGGSICRLCFPFFDVFCSLSVRYLSFLSSTHIHSF